MTEPLLRIDRLALAIGDLNILDDVSMDVGRGEFVSILGPSGAGKSTIFKVLTGATRADAGAITFDGKPLTTDIRPFAFMPQRDALMPWRRMIDNVTLGLEVQGVKRREARRRVEPLIADFGLAGFERHYPGALSGGMRQRAALLRTVLQDRSILLLDEPFSALDALTRHRMQLWLQEMWMRHRWTVVLITHDVREAVRLSDRVYVLSSRPARIVDAIDIALPRPRMMDASGHAAAATIESKILDHLCSPTE